MRRVLAAAVLMTAIACAVATQAAAATVDHVRRANLDGDAHVEQVRLVSHDRRGMGWSWLQVVDRVGGRREVRRISPSVQGLAPRDVRIADLTAQPGRTQVFYVGFDGTTGGHVYAGVRAWDGRAKHRLWSLTPAMEYIPATHRGTRYASLPNQPLLRQLASGGEKAWEISWTEGEFRYPNEPVCCPDHWYRRLYRFDPRLDTWVVYGFRWGQSSD